MLEIIQAGQAGKTRLMFEMHRLRKRVFKDRMQWDVSVNAEGLEVDEFDTPEAVYILALDTDQRVLGSARMLPTVGPTMIRDVWPQFLNSLAMPYDPFVWELSRLAIDTTGLDKSNHMAQIHKVTQEIFCGIAEMSILCGIRQIFALHDLSFNRLLKRLDCSAAAQSEILEINKKCAQVSAHTMDWAMLKRLRAAAGMRELLTTPENLPPTLHALHQQTLVCNDAFMRMMEDTVAIGQQRPVTEIAASISSSKLKGRRNSTPQKFSKSTQEDSKRISV